MRSFLVRAGVVLAVAATAVLGFSAPASAHVTVNPNTATQGGRAQLAFRVPNEKATASTVKLEVQFPQDAPIASVSVKPVPGWSVDLQRVTLAQPVTGSHGEQISEVIGVITWTASPGAEIAPGQYQEFELSTGPLPNVDQVIFKALQTYSDGEVVRWIDVPTADVPEVDHPAPILRLQPAAAAPAPAEESGSENAAAIGLGIAGLVLGLAGLAVGLLAYRRASA
jgi:uncharacterized protein YcnI